MLTRTIWLLPLLSSAILAQSSAWVRNDLRGPGGGIHITAYDTQRQRVVLFEDGTWEWDGAAWTRRTSPNAPPPRTGGALSYDSDRRVVVLFGGGFPGLDDTWEWDGVDWVQRTPAHNPPLSKGHGMVYDPLRRRTLLVTESGQTWEWDGVDWTQVTSAHAPPPRGRFGLVWDERRHRAVLFGGQVGFSGSYG